MTQPTNRSRFTRFGLAAGLLAASAVVVAARPQVPAGTTGAPSTGQPQLQPPVQAPRDTTTAAPVGVPSSIGVQPDSTSAQGAPTMADSAQPSMTQTEVPQLAASAPATWPVDEQGRTLINGEPVVGRVFVMQKTDGLRKYEGVGRHYVGEPLPPEAPTIGTGYVQPMPEAARRHRGSMVQATLWEIDSSPSAIEKHHYRPTTTTGATTIR
ncbi:MAG TPA: hypothetical protein VE869_11245 [Gemmatimonas sp.]|nr:hypothetical protein [Gemmatimonas sp.]